MTTKEFVEKLEQEVKENNLENINKIKAVDKNPEALYALAQEAGVTDSFEQFMAELSKRYDRANEELSEEELLAVAGGSAQDVLETTAFIMSGFLI